MLKIHNHIVEYVADYTAGIEHYTVHGKSKSAVYNELLEHVSYVFDDSRCMFCGCRMPASWFLTVPTRADRLTHYERHMAAECWAPVVDSEYR